MVQLSMLGNVSRKHMYAGFIVVLLSMALMFSLPSSYFIPGAFVATSCMIIVTFLLSRYLRLFRPSLRSLSIGVLSAVFLYLIFYAGNAGIMALHPLGIGASSESAIYSLISGHPLYVQAFVLIFDAVGYESYFRGILQNYIEGLSKGKSSFLAIAISAFIDSLIHLISLNLLWVITTFVADFVWGTTYRFSRDLSSNTLSHLVWDIAIFIVVPIK